MDNYIKVAGVTFTNENGESRQEILKNFGFGYRYAILKQTTFDGERAVEVWVDSKLIGYVPKTQLNNPLSYEELMLVQIMYYEEKDIYCAEISAIQHPDEQDVAKIRAFCTEKGLDIPYISDKRVYGMFIVENK